MTATAFRRPVPTRAGILDIAPYVQGASTLEGVAKVHKLASNEAALGPSPKAVAAFRDTAASLHLYPDGQCGALRLAIADAFDMVPERLIFANGSEAILDLLIRTHAGPGDEVLWPRLSFPLYRIQTLAAGAQPIEAEAPDFTADVDALLGAVTPATRVVILANPNNPTGTWIPRADLVRLREGLREDVLLIIDSAYGEYPEDPSYSDGRDVVDAHPDNTVMTRTFSKMYAIANARVGWAYAGPGLIDVMERVRLTFCVGAQAQAAAVAALGDQDHVGAERAHCLRWRTQFEAALSAAGLPCVQGAGNFVFLSVPNRAGGWQGFDAHLKRHGIIARPIPPANALRISIGSEEANLTLLSAVASAQQALNGPGAPFPASP
ncbi:MAG: pyridoxal phosphate-dependent aminotransferase [Alphaproteobacteria bacterium]